MKADYDGKSAHRARVKRGPMGLRLTRRKCEEGADYAEFYHRAGRRPEPVANPLYEPHHGTP